ncbi:ArsR/SmtB family transcription factor [Saccharothrix longispora]|uniref:ArsR family transcriptional regulator n=1 Tax=Saccharothrix longispora TaxID=33920 RepID=A0ABU1PTP0_9PSEU|nr:helix-turn-helix domain-containing protein [Saccharothrix longispora]MDR6593249.1 putative ArsR family transcriptional regulator [Saccharothrix longispora]
MPSEPDRDPQDGRRLPPDHPPRDATVAELKALAHPLRWRVLRLCWDRPLTNKELSQRLGVAPATMLRHVRALVRTEFLVAEPVRSGTRGALERPYRSTGRTRRLGLIGDPGDGLAVQADLALLDAHRAEVREAGPDADREIARGVLRLGPESREELVERVRALLDEFVERDEPDGEDLGYLWSLVTRREPGAAS